MNTYFLLSIHNPTHFKTSSTQC